MDVQDPTAGAAEVTAEDQIAELTTILIFQAGVDVYNQGVSLLANTKSLEESGQ